MLAAAEFEEQMIWASIGGPLLAGLAAARLLLFSGRNTNETSTRSVPATPVLPVSVAGDVREEDGPLLTIVAFFGGATRQQLIDRAFSSAAEVDVWLADAQARLLIVETHADKWAITDAGRRRLQHLS